MPSAVSRQEPTPERPADVPDLSKKLPSLGKPRSHPKKRSPNPTSPAVETPTLSEPPSAVPKFKRPVRRILSPHDHRLFLDSSTHTLIVAFAFNIADSVHDRDISSVKNEPIHATVAAVLTLLDRTRDLVEQHPPADNDGSRFGNPIFREFIQDLTSKSDVWHAELFNLPTPYTSPPDSTSTPTAITELSTYYTSSLGSPLRIDYGSGHELNLLTHLLVLNRLSLLPPSTFPSLALLVLPRYLNLMRTLQSTYYLEPAGSHGVWGLDDYQFLPFLFGAAQLRSHPFIRPLAIHSQATLDAYGDEYLYLDMVRVVNATKTVKGLRWHSPMLDDISGVKEGWGKVETGMRRMFVGEVLGKLVVMQHFLFGGCVSAVEGMTEAAEGDRNAAKDDVVDDGEVVRAEGHTGHAHNSDAWGDCCGIKVPSGVGAAQEMKKRMGGAGLRPLPFD